MDNLWGKAAVIVLILLALILSGCARFRHLSPEERAERTVEFLAEKLELDQYQHTQIEKIKGELLTKRAEMKAHRKETFDQIIALLRQDEIDEDEYQILIQKHQEHAKGVIAFFGDKFAEFHALLTPEQRTKVVDIMEKHKEDNYWRK